MLKKEEISGKKKTLHYFLIDLFFLQQKTLLTTQVS